MRFSLRTLTIVTAIVALITAMGVNCLGPIRAYSSVARIHEGMPQSDVRRILGIPNGETSRDSWTYERFMNPGWLVVYFDGDGNVQYVDHEPVFP